MKKFLIIWSGVVVLLGILLFIHIDKFSLLGKGNLAQQSGKLKELKKSYDEQCTAPRTRRIVKGVSIRKKEKAFYPNEGPTTRIKEDSYNACEELRRDIKSREIALQQLRENSFSDDEGTKTAAEATLTIILILFWFVPLVAANLISIAWKNRKAQGVK